MNRLRGGGRGNPAGFLLALLCLVPFYAVHLALEPETIRALCREDGIIEYMGALSFLAASAFFLASYTGKPEPNDFSLFKTRRNVFFLLLALVFFVGFGEEISWGQRIFGFATPAELGEVNRQQEFNIHNIDVFHGRDAMNRRKTFLPLLLNFDRLFSVFWFGFCVLLPAAVLLSERFHEWQKRVNIPAVPLWLGTVFPANYLVFKLLERGVPLELKRHLTETKEASFAFLFLLLSLHLYREGAGRTSRAERLPPPPGS